MMYVASYTSYNQASKKPSNMMTDEVNIIVKAHPKIDISVQFHCQYVTISRQQWL